MKIVGLMVCGVGESERYLTETLDEFKRLCDTAVIACNGKDTFRDKLIDKYGFQHYRDDREWGKEQPYIKTQLLHEIGKLNPNWIVPLDADETFTPHVTREVLEMLAEDGVGYYFYLVNHWNSLDRYVKGLSFWNVRFFKYMPELGLQYQRKPVHCGLAPPYAYHLGKYAPYIIRHYGLMNKEDRLAKSQRYKKYDPNAVYKSDTYYESLLSDTTGSEFVLEDVMIKVRENVANMQQPKVVEHKISNYSKTMETEKRIAYVQRIEDGKTLDIPERHLAETLKRGGFVFVGYAGEGDSKVISPPKEQPNNELICGICGFEAKSKLGLTSHNRKHNG